MKKNKDAIHKALTASLKGNAAAFKKHIKEAILEKVQKALAKREREIAKDITKGS